jgi:hypothetical protein
LEINEEFEIELRLQGFLELVAFPFPLLVFIVCILTPAYNNNKGRCLINLSLWLTALQILQTFSKLIWIEDCGFLSYAIHFSAMSYFCWLNVTSYDIFRTIK